MSGRARKFLLLALAALMWVATGVVQRTLNVSRAQLGLTRVTPLENAPPLLAFTTVALGGFRGLIANALWIRAGANQEAGRYFEAVQLSDWIAKLQPHSAAVWRYQAWNMTYNISVKFRDPQDRWRWVLRGIELLRDEGLRYHPSDSQMYHELAWFFEHKLGHYMDDAHMYYKQQWAMEMSRVLGAEKPDYLSLINPKTDDERRWATILRARFKLDPERMRAIDERFGPLEWRLPESHAIYWAMLGLERSGKEGQLNLRRVVWQSMQTAFLRGRLVHNSVLRRFEAGPNLAILGHANKAYEDMMTEDPANRDAMMPGHKNFLKEAVYLLYIHNRVVEADQWMRRLREKYPDAVPAGQSLDDFAVANLNVKAQSASVDRIRATITGLLTSSYINLAIGETGQSEGLDHLARQFYNKHQLKFANQQDRMGLRPLKEIREEVLGELLDPKAGIHPQLQAQLRTALNLPAPTNASPAVTAPPK